MRSNGDGEKSRETWGFRSNSKGRMSGERRVDSNVVDDGWTDGHTKSALCGSGELVKVQYEFVEHV